MTKKVEDLSPAELKLVWEREQARKAKQLERARAKRASLTDEDRARQQAKAAAYRQRRRAVLDRAAQLFKSGNGEDPAGAVRHLAEDNLARDLEASLRQPPKAVKRTKAVKAVNQ